MCTAHVTTTDSVISSLVVSSFLLSPYVGAEIK